MRLGVFFQTHGFSFDWICKCSLKLPALEKLLSHTKKKRKKITWNKIAINTFICINGWWFRTLDWTITKTNKSFGHFHFHHPKWIARIHRKPTIFACPAKFYFKRKVLRWVATTTCNQKNKPFMSSFTLSITRFVK